MINLLVSLLAPAKKIVRVFNGTCSEMQSPCYLHQVKQFAFKLYAYDLVVVNESVDA